MEDTLTELESLNDEDDDDYILWYTNKKDDLEKIWLCEVPKEIFKRIAVMVHNTLFYRSDWQEYAFEMGVYDSYTLAEISTSSNEKNELPLYCALENHLVHQAKFSTVIDVLIKRQRLDILRKIKPNVEDFLERIKHSPSQSTASHQVCPYEHSASSDFVPVKYVVCLPPEIEEEQKQNRVAQNLNKNTNALINFSSLKRNFNTEQEQKQNRAVERLNRNVYNFISLKRNPFISAFIVHLSIDTEVSQILANELRIKYNINAKLISEIEHLISLNSCKVFNKILSTVDFIVVVISQAYLENICSLDSVDEQSKDVSNNLYVFSWIQSDFTKNSCLNIRVKPVMVENVDICLVRQEPIFDFPLRLWSDVPRLVDIMTKTKKSFPFLFKKTDS